MDDSAARPGAGRGCEGPARPASADYEGTDSDLSAVLEAQAFVAGLDDIAVMGETVEPRLRYAVVICYKIDFYNALVILENYTYLSYSETGKVAVKRI